MTRARRPHSPWHTLLEGFVVLAFSIAPLAGQAQQLSLQEAVEEAINSSPEVLIARERVSQAKEGVKETRGEMRPQVDFSVSGGREFNTPAGGRPREATSRGEYSTSYDATLGASQKIYDGARTRSEILKREEILEGTSHRATAIRHRVAQEMVETFLKIYQQQQALTSVNIFVQRLEDLSAKMDLYAEEGNASKTLQKYVSSRLANAKQVQVQITNALQDSLEGYTFLTQKTLDLSTTSLVLMKLPALDNFDTYNQTMLNNNPELKASIADLDAAKAEYQKAKGNFFPTLNLNTEWADNRDVGGKVGQVRGGSAMLEMRYKVYDGNSRDATLRRMASQEREKDLQIQRVRRKNDQSLRSAWQTLSAKLEEEKLIRQELADTMDVRNLRQQEFEEGAGDLVQLVETEEKLFAAARQKLNVDTAILTNRFSLEFLTGTPHLDGSEIYLPFNPFDRLKSYSELLEKKALLAPAIATTGNTGAVETDAESLPMPETQEEASETPDPIEQEAAPMETPEQPAAPVEPAAERKEEKVTRVEPVSQPTTLEEDTQTTSQPDAVEASQSQVEATPVDTTPAAEGKMADERAAQQAAYQHDVERLLEGMTQIEPAAGSEPGIAEPAVTAADVGAYAVVTSGTQKKGLALPDDFTHLPLPAGR